MPQIVTIEKRGPAQWRVKIRRRGYPTETGTFETRDATQRYARRIEGEIDRGIPVFRAEAERPRQPLPASVDFYIYVLLDIFSRYVVGWMVADRENSALAGRLIEETCHKQGVEPQVLTLHSDRGAPMTSKCTAQLLADLGVTRSLSRPQVSDDNPFSEAQFKTLKYHPGFPSRFPDIDAATSFCRPFFPWYNAEHRHGGIAMLTPDEVHPGRAQTVLAQRERTLPAAWTPRPERCVRGLHYRSPLPEAVWINPPATSTNGGVAQ